MWPRLASNSEAPSCLSLPIGITTTVSIYKWRHPQPCQALLRSTSQQRHCRNSCSYDLQFPRAGLSVSNTACSNMGCSALAPRAVYCVVCGCHLVLNPMANKHFMDISKGYIQGPLISSNDVRPDRQAVKARPLAILVSAILRPHLEAFAVGTTWLHVFE